jgi:phosphonate transport system substrate-binding protein
LYDALYQGLADAQGLAKDAAPAVIQAPHDPLEDAQIGHGADESALYFMCGLPLTRLEHAAPGHLVPIAAPVMRAPRYAGKPIYFADVIVRADSLYQTFADLRGSAFSYNDSGSQSGYHAVRSYMVQTGRIKGYFSRVIRSGSHLNSIQCVLQGEADCAAIDSLVLEQALAANPALASKLRIVESIGPFPNPPIVASRQLFESVMAPALMLHTPDVVFGVSDALRTRAGVARFARVTLEDYVPLWDLYAAADAAGYRTIY